MWLVNVDLMYMYAQQYLGCWIPRQSFSAHAVCDKVLGIDSCALTLELARVTILITKIVFLCVYSWWGPVLTCSVWCPSWCLSLFHLWSSFFRSSSNSFQRCCPPPSRQSPKRHVLMYSTHRHTHPAARVSSCRGSLCLCNFSDMAFSIVLITSSQQGSWFYLIAEQI